MSEKDGGAAFPFYSQFQLKPGEDLANYIGRGMSLRQWYAGMALPAVIQAEIEKIKLGGRAESQEETARACFSFADAMLAEGEKGK